MRVVGLGSNCFTTILCVSHWSPRACPLFWRTWTQALDLVKVKYLLNWVSVVGEQLFEVREIMRNNRQMSCLHLRVLNRNVLAEGQSPEAKKQYVLHLGSEGDECARVRC